MECSQVLSLLSRYLDGDLPREVGRLVEEHLSGCTGCSSHMEELVEAVRALNSLERIAAPQGFLSRVHERIEEPSRVQRLLRRLFSPLHIKLPLEAVGLGIAVLLVIVVQREIAPIEQKTMISRVAETTVPSSAPAPTAVSPPTPTADLSPSPAPAAAPAKKAATVAKEETYRTLPSPRSPSAEVRDKAAPAARPGTPPAGLAAAPRRAAPAAGHEMQLSPQAGKLIQLTLLIVPSHKMDEPLPESASTAGVPPAPRLRGPAPAGGTSGRRGRSRGRATIRCPGRNPGTAKTAETSSCKIRPSRNGRDGGRALSRRSRNRACPHPAVCRRKRRHPSGNGLPAGDAHSPVGRRRNARFELPGLCEGNPTHWPPPLPLSRDASTRRGEHRPRPDFSSPSRVARPSTWETASPHDGPASRCEPGPPSSPKTVPQKWMLTRGNFSAWTLS